MLVLKLHLEQRVGQGLQDRCHYLNRIFLRQTLSSKGPDSIPTPRRITCFADLVVRPHYLSRGQERDRDTICKCIQKQTVREGHPVLYDWAPPHNPLFNLQQGLLLEVPVTH